MTFKMIVKMKVDAIPWDTLYVPERGDMRIILLGAACRVARCVISSHLL